MRTPKIEALHRMIKWCNHYYYGVKPGAEITLLGLDLSPLQNNNWLSGFIDGDGSFYFNWLYDKKNLPTSIQYYMRISQRQNYNKHSAINDLFNISYFNIMNKIAVFLSVPLRSRVRNRKNNFIESLYEVRSANYISNYTILSYLLKYPLFSYKYREIAVQLELLKLSKNKNYKLINGLKILEDLKLKSKGTNIDPCSSLSKNTNYFIHTSFYFPFFLRFSFCLLVLALLSSQSLFSFIIKCNRKCYSRSRRSGHMMHNSNYPNILLKFITKVYIDTSIHWFLF